MNVNDGVYGMQLHGGTFVIQGSHECAKQECKRPAVIAVFGMLDDDGTVGRLNVCRPHAEMAMGDLIDPWICALMADREQSGEYCQHCAARTIYRDGIGHLLCCPVGLTFPDIAARKGVMPMPHDMAACEVCTSYHERKPGPTG